MPSNHLTLCLPLLYLPSIFPSIRVFASSGQSIGASASASVLPMNSPGRFPLGLTGLISLQSKGLSRVFSNTTIWKPYFFSTQPSLWSNSHMHTWLLEKTIALTKWTFVSKVMSLFFNTLSSFVIAFLQRSKSFNFMISWLQSLSAVILEPKKIKFATVCTFPPSICHEVMGPDAMILVFRMLSFKPAFSLSSFTFIKSSLVLLCFLPLEWYHLHFWGCWCFSWQLWFQLVSHPAQHFSWCILHTS